MQRLSRLATRRFPVQEFYSREQAYELASLAVQTGRQIGLLIERTGRPYLVILGTPKGILIPPLDRYRESPGRLRGLRLLRVSLREEGVGSEDLMDMVFLRLDAAAVLGLDPDGQPSVLSWAHILPDPRSDQPYRVSETLPWSRTPLDVGRTVEAVEQELARAGTAAEQENVAERAVLVGVDTLPHELQERSLDELAELCRTAGLEPRERIVQRVSAVNPKFLLGKGKLLELEIATLRHNAGTILFDRELSPAQMRNLADVTERKILDRTQLILDIFAQHAVSREGKLQVELAQLKYALPRLIGKNPALSRLAGGIGGRGPGETKLEMDRRRIRERMTHLKKEIQKVRRHREAGRSRRSRVGLPVVALVGYTNAGKSTLLNALTGSTVLARDTLFATLDPSSRRLRFPHDTDVIVTDTVGFIRHLPDDLKEAFMATLEELRSADLLVHVVDASSPEAARQVTAVETILEDLELTAPVQVVLNKWDLVGRNEPDWLLREYPDAVTLSALRKENLPALAERILSRLPAGRQPAPSSVESENPWESA